MQPTDLETAAAAFPLLDSVEQWRLEQLLDAGYPLSIAEQLAVDRTVDLHEAVRLLERGCQPELAAAILL